MGRGKGERFQKKGKPIKVLDLFLVSLIFIAWVLIKIGETVKWASRIFLKFGLSSLGILNSKLRHIKLKRSKQLLHKVSSLWSFVSLKLNSLRSFFLLEIEPIKLPKLEIRNLGPKFVLPRLKITPQFKWFILGILFTILFVFIPFQVWSWLVSLPNPRLLSVREIPVTTKIFDRNGFLLYEIYAEQNRTPVPLTEIPKSLILATIAIEDQNFYTHPGFSPRGILRAAKEIAFHRRLQGGSTITQQLIRSALLTPAPSLVRKTKEIILSFWAERIYGKDQILEMYLNQVPYGGTAWGIQAAAQTYFGKDIKNLSLPEAAFLAGLPASPSVYSPFGTHPELGLARQKEVLAKMREQGFISSQQEEEAKTQTLEFVPPKTGIKAPHFVMYVKHLLEEKYGPRLTQMGGLRVTTTLDLSIQEAVSEIVFQEVEKLGSLRVGNGAALVTNPKTGEILSMVGSKNYFDQKNEGNVNIALSTRQPGSSIKVVNYALALQKSFTAATILDDSPITYQVAGQPPFSPVNYDRKFHGKLPLRFALGNSYNIPAVKVLAQLGVKNMIDQGKKMGITSWKDEGRFGLSLTLGGGEVTMLDMSRVYGTLANEGQKQELTAILKVSDFKGQVFEEFRSKQGFTAVPSGVAFVLANILADNQARSWAFGPNSLLNIPGKTVSVKTGTSNDLRDNWTIGFTPSFVVVTWVGNNDNSPMSAVASGVTGATPIWHQIMKNLLKDQPDEPILPPEEVVAREVCGRTEYFIRGTEKSVFCPPPASPLPSP